MITQGKWEVSEDGASIGVGSGKTYERICQIVNPRFLPSIEDCANARLIAAACNACQEINPANPQAAAEALVGLYEACKIIQTVRDAYRENGKPFDEEALDKQLDEALAKAEGKD